MRWPLTILVVAAAALLAGPDSLHAQDAAETPPSELEENGADQADHSWWPGLSGLKLVTRRDEDAYHRSAVFRSFTDKAEGLQVLLTPTRPTLSSDWTIRYEIVVAGENEIDGIPMDGEECPQLSGILPEFAAFFEMSYAGGAACTVERPGGAAPLILIRGTLTAED